MTRPGDPLRALTPFPEQVLSRIFLYLFTEDGLFLHNLENPSALCGPTFRSLLQVNSVFHTAASKYAARRLYRPDVSRPGIRPCQQIAPQTRSVVLNAHSTRFCQAHCDEIKEDAQDIPTLVVAQFWDVLVDKWPCVHGMHSRDPWNDHKCGYATKLRPKKLIVHGSTAVFPQVHEEKCLPKAVLDSATTHVYRIDQAPKLLGHSGKPKPFLGGVGGLTPKRAAKLSDIVIVFPVEEPGRSWHAKHRGDAAAEGGWLWEVLDRLAYFIARVPPSCRLTVVHAGAIDVIGDSERIMWSPQLRQNRLHVIFRRRLDFHFANRRGITATCIKSIVRPFRTRRARERDMQRLHDRHDAVRFITMEDYVRNEDWVDVLDTATAQGYMKPRPASLDVSDAMRISTQTFKTHQLIP